VGNGGQGRGGRNSIPFYSNQIYIRVAGGRSGLERGAVSGRILRVGRPSARITICLILQISVRTSDAVGIKL
jgi:hypothetical protein